MSNDFLAWAVGGSANVESQAAYAVDANLNNGYPANAIVPSGTFNKTLRQASFVAAAIAQFMADNLAASVSDNGSVSTVEGQLRSALGYAAGVQVWSFSGSGFSFFKAVSFSGGNLTIASGLSVLAGGAFFNGQQFYTGPKNIQNGIASGTPVTVATVPTSGTWPAGVAGDGLWICRANYAGVSAHESIAFVSVETSVPTIIATIGNAGITWSISGQNIQATQTSGIAQSIISAYTVLA